MNETAAPDRLLARALTCHQQGQVAEAETLYQEILAADPRHAKALMLLGVCRLSRGQHAEALAAIDRALALDGEVFQAHYNRGLALKSLARTEEALASFDLAIDLNPSFAPAHCNKANVLKEAGRLDEALEGYHRAIALDPKLAEAYNNRGAVFQARADFQAALADYNTALALRPGYLQARYNRGLVLLVHQHFEAALADFDQAVNGALTPPYALGHWLQTKKILCDWTHIREGETRLLSGLEKGERVAVPFGVAAMPSTPAQQLQTARIYAEDKYPATFDSYWSAPPYAHDRIRVAYISADYHDHATSHLIAELIERHNRSRFEIIGISIGPDRRDGMRDRMARAFDAFHDVREWTDDRIGALCRELEIDIAVDLKGHTFEARTGIFARRAAPIQVNYLGYPGTMGVDYMDYIIADPTVIAPEHRPFYSEQVVYLPHCYQANDATKAIAESAPSRPELGLPEAGFVFCCFNNSYKLSPDVFDIWMRLLGNTPGSVLWLLDSHPATTANLRQEAEKRGISPDRLVFAPRAPLPDHLARHRHADLFLDTFYYNAHTTTSDALWAGLPVLTCLGEAFAGRVAASLLKSVGLPELVATSRESYEALALELAHAPEKLGAIRAKLGAGLAHAPLFDTPRFTRHLELAYVEMWERHQAGLAPGDIAIRDDGATAGNNTPA